MRTVFAAALLCITSAVGAQTRPDFSGTWVRVVDSAAARPSVATAGDASFRTGDMGSGWGSPLTIAQRADSLIVEYVFFATYDLQPPVRLAYAMGGSESRNTVMIGHADSKTTGRLTWRDSSIVVATRYPIPDSDGRDYMQVTRVLTLTSLSSLVIDATFGSPHGMIITTKTSYTKR